MAERRMFAKTIIDSDAFTEMPLSTQALYFHLSMRADDDGFLNCAQKIMRMIGAAKNDFDLLVVKRFIIQFPDGICVIKHWRIHNYLRKDRYTETVYTEHMAALSVKENGAYSVKNQDSEALGIPDGNQRLTQVSIVEDSIVKGSKGEDDADKPRKSTREFIPPSLQEVQDYAASMHLDIDPAKFMSYYTASDWHDSQGKKVRNWKQKAITWSGRGKKPEKKSAPTDADYEHSSSGYEIL